MPYTTPTTITTGQFITAALMNSDWVENIKFLANPPTCRVYNSSALSIPNGGETVLTFNSENHDVDSMHSTSVNTSRITFNTAGVYVVTLQVDFVTNGTGMRYAYIEHSTAGAIGLVGCPANGSIGTALTVTTQFKVAAGSYVQAKAWQNSGGSLNISANAYSPVFAATWVGQG